MVMVEKRIVCGGGGRVGVVNHLEAMYLAIAWHTVTSFGSLHLLSKSVCGWAAVLNGVMAAMAAKRVHIERTVEASQLASHPASHHVCGNRVYKNNTLCIYLKVYQLPSLWHNFFHCNSG